MKQKKKDTRHGTDGNQTGWLEVKRAARKGMGRGWKSAKEGDGEGEGGNKRGASLSTRDGNNFEIVET